MKKGKEQKLLEALRTQEPWGLEAAINRYAPYVAGVDVYKRQVHWVVREVFAWSTRSHDKLSISGNPPVVKQ